MAERWQELEDYVAATLPKAKKTKASGAVRRDGDMHTPRYLVECKAKSNSTGVSITGAELKKGLQQAIKKNRQLLFVVENGQYQKFAVLRYEELVKLLETLAIYAETEPDLGDVLPEG